MAVKFVKWLLLGSVILVAALFLWQHFRTSDEQRIRRRFDDLAGYVSKGAGEGNIQTTLKGQGLGMLFADSCTLAIAAQSLAGTYTPEEIVSHAVRARAQFDVVDLDFHDITVRFPSDREAQVTCTVRFSARRRTGERVGEVRELKCRLKKRQDTWLFSRFEVVEVLRK